MLRALGVGFKIILACGAVGVVIGFVTALGSDGDPHPATQLFVATVVGTCLGLFVAIVYITLAAVRALVSSLVSEIRLIVDVLGGGVPLRRANPYESPVWDRELDG